jgi:hypothetical protein
MKKILRKHSKSMPVYVREIASDLTDPKKPHSDQIRAFPGGKTNMENP